MSGASKYDLLPLLIELAKRGCLDFPQRVSRTDVMRSLGVSAWKFRKLLEEAENEGFIERIALSRYVALKITPRGKSFLESVYSDLLRVFNSSLVVSLRGTVVPGLGEGAMYMSIPKYVEAFREVLGFEPFPGTLNIRLDEESVKKRLLVRNSKKGILIPGFSLNGKEYCSVTVYKAVITANGVTVFGAALDIEKTKHGDDVLELVSQVKLRDEMKLRDGDTVEVKIVL